MLVFWLVCFIALFGATEFYRWLTHLINVNVTGFNWAELPLPIFILAGVALAIASNRSKQSGLPFQESFPSPKPKPSTADAAEDSPQSASATPAATPAATAHTPAISAASAPKIQMRSASAQAKTNSPTISYTIDKDNHRSERRPKNP